MCMSITGWCFEYGFHIGIILIALNVIYFLNKKGVDMKTVKQFLGNLSQALMETTVHISRPVIGISLYA